MRYGACSGSRVDIGTSDDYTVGVAAASAGSVGRLAADTDSS